MRMGCREVAEGVLTIGKWGMTSGPLALLSRGMSDALTLFDGELPLFEQKGRPNGCTTWSAEDLAEWLGYPNYSAFRGVIKKAQEVLLSCNIEVTDHFFQEATIDEKGRAKKDLRLTRFACYLAAMNGDVKKKQVAQAQVYFARFNEACQRYLDDADPVNRVLVRKEVSKQERTLSRVAHGAGVKDYARFRSAGYLGLYNMNLADLKKVKGIPDGRCAYDFMGPQELAANLFRISETEAKIKSDHVRGQTALEKTAMFVGATVRDAMEKISGDKPEELPAQEDIRKVKAGLKESADVLKHGGASDMKALPEAETYLEEPPED